MTVCCYRRIARIATQTKKITVPPRNSTRASFSIPDTARLPEQRGEAPEDIVEGVAHQYQEVQERQREDQTDGRHRARPGPSPPQYRKR